MAKRSKLTKLKSMVKRFHAANIIGQMNNIRKCTTVGENFSGDRGWRVALDPSENVPTDFQTVYVGKSRRRYVVSSEIVNHIVFRELIERTDPSDGLNIGCEVVLFEHLLWMIQNAEPDDGSIDELVEFYACPN